MKQIREARQSMYLHLGGTYAISDKWIVGIFDIDQTTLKRSSTVDFLQQADKKGQIELISSDIPRSFIVTLEKVYLSPIASATLRKRLEQMRSIRTESENESGR